MYNLSVPVDLKVSDFIEKALAAGLPHDSLVGVLTSQGWSEKEIYEGLADHYQRVIGLDVPRRTSSGSSAKEAFFYLLMFATLATWTVGFGCLAFVLIDRWLADPLFSSYPGAFDTYTIASSLAALIVAFPLYLLISRAVVRETGTHPEKLDSSIRKWLTYMALVIAAAVFMGDLIAALSYFLRGEITSRFLAKSAVVLALSGSVFFYYFGGLRKVDAIPARLGRDRLMAGLSSIIVAAIIVIGFVQLGSPRVQRDLRADTQRVQDVYYLSTDVKDYWTSHGSQLPASIDQISQSFSDPVTHASYEYHRRQGSQYELCARFAYSSARRKGDTARSTPWSHPAGHFCFLLDTSTATQYPQQLIGYPGS